MADWGRLLLAWFWLPVIDLSLRARGFAATRLAVVGRPALGGEASSVQALEARRLARVVSIAARRSLWPTSCLRQALLLERWLVRASIPCTLRIGVSRDLSLRRQAHREEPIAAHAWIEVNGESVLGGAASPERYTTII
jgi:hypothetical protein